MADKTLAEQHRAITTELFELWDSDQDMKVGKILRALSGSTGYRPDIDALNIRMVQVELENARLLKALRESLNLQFKGVGDAAIELAIKLTLEGHYEKKEQT